MNALQPFGIYLQDIERAYNTHNPYHNNVHAADVTQTLGCFLANDKFAHNLTDLEMAAMILATCIHDVGHPGQLCLHPNTAASCPAVSRPALYLSLPAFQTALQIIQATFRAQLRITSWPLVRALQQADQPVASVLLHTMSVLPMLKSLA